MLEFTHCGPTRQLQTKTQQWVPSCLHRRTAPHGRRTQVALASIRQHAKFASFSASAATLSAPTGDGKLFELFGAVDAAHHQPNRFGAVGTIAFRLFVERRHERVP